MKNKVKLFIAVIMIVLCVGLGIYYGTAAQHSEEKLVYGRYVLIDKAGDGIHGFSKLVYDKDTYVMYIFIDDSAMSPYYIVKDKETIVGIYNVNWFGVDNYE